jgi:hypothetical protein
MKCSICGKTEEDFQNNIVSMIKKLEKIIVINNSITEKYFVENKIQKYIMENGFTNQNKEKLQLIDDSIKNVTVSAIKENETYFLKIEPKLELLLKYNSNNGNIKTVNDLIISFCSEPNEDIKIQYKKEYDTAINNIKIKNNSIEKAIEQLKHVKIKFYEKSINIKNILNIMDKEIENVLNENCSEEYLKEYKLYFCPICKSVVDSIYIKIQDVEHEIESTNNTIRDNWLNWSS